MPTMNAQIFLNTFSDTHSSNAPSLNNVRWCRNLDGVVVKNPTSRQLVVPAGQTTTLFSTTRTIEQTNQTRYTLSISPFDSQYILTRVQGPTEFRESRNLGLEPTSAVNVTMSGSLMVISAATAIFFTNALPGDYVQLANAFSPLNMGIFKVLAANSTSITVENPQGVAEAVALGENYIDQLMVYSPAGVQVGDSLVIPSGFSPVTRQTFVVTKATPNALEFASTQALPLEANINTHVQIYGAAKKLIYMETDQKLVLGLNSDQSIEVSPMIVNDSVLPGIFMSTSTIYAMTITNPGITDANLFIISAE